MMSHTSSRICRTERSSAAQPAQPRCAAHHDQWAERDTRLSLLQLSRGLVALDEIRLELGKRPRDAQLRLLAADACQRLGALPEAADHLAAILITEPDHLEANRRLARLLCELGDASGALRCAKRWLELSGENEASALADLGLVLLAAGREDEALAHWTRALELDPQSASAHCGFGLAHYEHERWREAVAAFQATALLAPESAVGPFNLALVFERLGEPDQARRALLRAAALEPHDEQIQSALEPLLLRPSIVPRAEPVRQPGAAMRGALDSFDLFDLLEFLRSQEKTGRLVVSGPPGVGMLRLERGLLIGGSAPRLRAFGEILVRRGLISRAQLEHARSLEHRPPGAPAHPERPLERDATSLAAVLLRERLIEEGALSDVLLKMTLHIISQIKQWRDGVFAFHSAPDTGFPIGFNVQQVALELTRIEDEKQRRMVCS